MLAFLQPNDFLMAGNLLFKAVQLYKNFPSEIWDDSAYQFLELNKEERWCFACSGGADSIFGLLNIRALYKKCQERISVIHFNHEQRKHDSTDDQKYVEKVTRELGFTFYSKNLKSSSDMSEGEMRQERMFFFDDIMKKTQARVLIQGHNSDDVAETLLWRISRGVGVEGLCSPRPIQKYKNYHIIRPFLSISKKDIKEALVKHDIPWREDSTNQSEKYLRNRLRLNTLPNWKKDVDRDLLKGVLKTRKLLDEQNEALNHFVDSHLVECLLDKDLNASKLSKLPKSILKKVVNKWVVELMRANPLTNKVLERIFSFVISNTDFKIRISSSTSIKCSGKILSLIRDEVIFKWKTCTVPLKFKLSLPNGYTLAGKKLELSDFELKKILAGEINQDETAYICPKTEFPEFHIRRRIEGDRFRPLGLNKSKKLKDIMIDKKWNNERKTNTPLVLNAEGEILWIPGFPPSESSKISSDSRNVISLTYLRTLS